MKVPETGNFMINGGNSEFANRQKALFDQLSRAEKDCKKDHTNGDQLEGSGNTFSRPLSPLRYRRKETRQFRGQESIFKRPALPSPFVDRSMPDHRRNPHKWRRYSLDDVLNDDMSEKANTNAALSFLSELKARKSKEKAGNKMKMEVDNSDSSSSYSGVTSAPSTSLIVFNRSLNKQKRQEKPNVIIDDNKTITFRGSKVILPEYVIGQKPINKIKKEKRQSSEQVDQQKKLKLDHLEEFDDDA